MNTTNWKIAEESKRKMVDGLLKALHNYDYDLITVTMITQEAKLSRKTFYRLFHDKDEVIELLFYDVCEECFKEIRESNAHHYWEVVQTYFDFWESRKELIDLLKKNNLLVKLLAFSYKNSFQIFEYVRTKEVMDQFSETLPYLLAYAVGGMHTMLIQWMEEGMKLPSYKLIEKLKVGFASPNI